MTIDPPSAAADSDEALLRAFVAAGDREAMGRLLLRHHAAAWALARSHGLSESDADDAVQAAFVAALGAAPRFAGRSAVKTWLLGFVVNACRNLARSHRRRRAHEGASPMPVHDTAGHDHSRELVAALREALEALPQRYRVPLELRFLHGLEPGEVARAIGSAPGTVRSLLSRGIAQLREALAARRLALEEGAIGAAIAALPAAAPAGAVPTAVAEWVRSGTVPAAKVAAAPALGVLAKLAIATVAAAAIAGGGVAVAHRAAPSAPPATATPAPLPPAPPATAQIAPPSDDSLDTPVSIRFAREDLSEALGHLAEASGFDWACPDPIRSSGRLTLATTRATVREILDQRIAPKGSGLRWEHHDGTLVVWKNADEAELAALIEHAAHGETESRCEAIAALGRLGDPRIYPPLFAAAADREPAVVEWALRTLRWHTSTLRFGTGVDDFASTLLKTIALPPPERARRLSVLDEDRNERAVRLLAATRSPRGADVLRAAIDVPPLHQMAWEGLCVIADAHAEDTAIAAYAEWTKRPHSADLASLDLGSLALNRDLARRLRIDDRDPSRREIALLAAQHWPRAGLIEPLRAALATSTPEARSTIASCLIKIATPEALALARSMPVAEGEDPLEVRAQQADAEAVATLRARLTGSDARERASALAVGAWHHRGPVLHPLITLMQNVGPDGLPLAVEAATAADGAEATPLKKLVAQLDPATAAGSAALAALAATRDDAATPVLLALVGHEQASVRRWIATLLPKTRDEAVLDALLKLSTDPDLDVRKAAIAGLDSGHWRTITRTGAFIGLLGERDPDGFAKVVMALVHTGDERAIEILADLVRQPDPNAAVSATPRADHLQCGFAAAAALLDFPDPRGGLALLPLLDSPVADTRYAASSGWRLVGLDGHHDEGIDPRFGERLMVLTTDSDERVRWNAALALSQLQPAGSLDRLLPMVGDPGPSVRADVLIALTRYLPDPRAAAALAPMIRDADPSIRRCALQRDLLALCPDPVGELLGLLEDGDPYVQDTAIGVAGGYAKDQRVADELRRIASTSPTPQLREAARRTLATAGLPVPKEQPAAAPPPATRPAADF